MFNQDLFQPALQRRCEYDLLNLHMLVCFLWALSECAWHLLHRANSIAEKTVAVADCCWDYSWYSFDCVSDVAGHVLWIVGRLSAVPLERTPQ